MQSNPHIDYKLLYEQKTAELASLQITVMSLQQQMAQLQKMIFGSRQEKFIAPEINHAQLSLDMQTESVGSCSVVNAQKISYTRTNSVIESKPLNHPGRMKLPDHLRREQIIIEPAEDITGCKKIGEEITEILEYLPGELYVKKFLRPKYALPAGDGVVIGTLPSRAIEKGMAGPGLLAQIIIDKYVDHLPLYRQMQRFERNGLKLSYSTISEWVSSSCKLITPLYEALRKEVLEGRYLHADETPIKVLDKDKKGQTHRGYYWVYQNSLKKLVLFDYQQGRGREGPMNVLENFEGYLQTDGYNAYEIFDQRSGITLMHCMAHARRMFHEAQDNDQERAAYALKKIGDLYTIERIIKESNLNHAEICEVRRRKSVLILKELDQWMKDQYVQVLPKSTIGKALAYSIERWKRLSIYTEHGMLNIDNNPVENSIRPVAIGRKNYLFAGSHEAAQRSAMLYSLLGTCKMHEKEPYQWLKETLEKIADHPINRIRELLPHYTKM